MKTAREGDTPSTLLFHFYGNNETKFPKIFRVRIRTPIAGGTVTALAVMPEAQLCLFCSPQGNDKMIRTGAMKRSVSQLKFRLFAYS